ncbi:MAG: DUF3347 domain-containing protein [Ferruginibacter sp.]
MKIVSTFIALLFSMTFAFAQTGAKTEKIKVWGNCGMCKGKIEKTAKKAGAKTADWNEDTHILRVTYAEDKTSNVKIQQAIAKAGYDTQDYTADNTAYDNLHGCCQYDRKEISKDVVMVKLPDNAKSAEVNKEVIAEKKNDLPRLLSAYYSVKDALVKSNANAAAAGAAELVKAIELTGKEELSKDLQKDLLKDANAIAQSKDLKVQRLKFATLSAAMVELAKTVKFSGNPVYQQYCPMQKASWLSDNKAIKNPYYGNAMLTCGNLKATF